MIAFPRNMLAALAFVLAFAGSAHAQRETITATPIYHGTTANAPTLAENHTMNRHPTKAAWGGCAPSATRTAALYAKIDRKQVDRFWAIAQERIGVGGTDPNTLAEMLNEAMPGAKWISYVGNDPEVALKLSAKGYLLCGTMAWGDRYAGRIAHWVNYNHIDRVADLACIEDNNDPPGVYRWTTATEALARIYHGGQGWVFAFTEQPIVAQAILPATLCLLASALLLAGKTVLILT